MSRLVATSLIIKRRVLKWQLIQFPYKISLKQPIKYKKLAIQSISKTCISFTCHWDCLGTRVATNSLEAYILHTNVLCRIGSITQTNSFMEIIKHFPSTFQETAGVFKLRKIQRKTRVAVTLKMKLQIPSCSFTKTRLYLGYFSKNLPSFRKNSFRKYWGC